MGITHTIFVCQAIKRTKQERIQKQRTQQQQQQQQQHTPRRRPSFNNNIKDNEKQTSRSKRNLFCATSTLSALQTKLTESVPK